MNEWVGFRDRAEAEALLRQAGRDYVITKIVNKMFDGETLAYVVMRKDIDPIAGESK